MQDDSRKGTVSEQHEASIYVPSCSYALWKQFGQWLPDLLQGEDRLLCSIYIYVANAAKWIPVYVQSAISRRYIPPPDNLVVLRRSEALLREQMPISDCRPTRWSTIEGLSGRAGSLRRHWRPSRKH